MEAPLEGILNPQQDAVVGPADVTVFANFDR